MNEKASLMLTHSFIFREKSSTYTISFYTNFLIIEDSCLKHRDPTTIQYAEVYKIRAGEKNLKIQLRDGTKITVPCTLAEIKRIKKLFKQSSGFKPSRVRSLAYVEFGSLSFFIKVDSNDYDTFKATIIKRIAKFFYPAFDQEGISLELFKKFVLKIKKCNKLVRIDTSEDLDAALMYFDYKIDITIEHVQESEGGDALT
ncbi:hypothetical protein PAEPH01_1416 [Pancytospora epiphaga]|nr:hypothetical protein PAEPH01_1416 [Pancytospora epiphaga]